MMKRILQLVEKTILTVVLVSAIFIRCDSDDTDGTNESRYLKRLSGSWRVAHVTLEGVDLSHFFEGLVLTINTDKTYAVLNGIPPIWPHSGSFTLVEDQPGQYHLMRQDGVKIQIGELAAESLRMGFSYQATASGRVSSVSGGYEFVFQRQ